jgi:omega-hydroxy-beta-dihydromenaquinone-9 sulfotransferase
MSASISNQPALSEPPKPAVKASRQGLICMWHGLTICGLCCLIHKKPRISWRYLPRWITIFLISGLNSFYGALEKLFFGGRVARTVIVHPPVFILGHWRSGTTMLHNLMSLDPQVTFPNLYQCVNPGHFLLTERILAPLTKSFLPKTRPMDNITAGWDEPQEEDIALALDCLISPYLMTAFSDRREVYERYFDPRDMTESERTRWKQSFLRLLKKITYRKNRSIVTKTPAHTFRISTLLEMFPDARFVYIKRDPYAVYQSTLHLRKTMFTENSLGPPEFSSNEDDMLYFYEKCIRTYEETKGLIPKGRLHEIRFEDLEQDPLGQIHQIYQTLSLPGWDLVKPKIEAQLPALKAYKKNAFRMDEATMQRVHSRLKWVFDLYGYPSHFGR